MQEFVTEAQEPTVRSDLFGGHKIFLSTIKQANVQSGHTSAIESLGILRLDFQDLYMQTAVYREAVRPALGYHFIFVHLCAHTPSLS